ncbi:MAG: PKD domain-containing protein [Draconibacterium sp.]
MRKPEFYFLMVFVAFVNLSALAQNQNSHFKMMGENPKQIEINQSYSSDTIIDPFGKNINRIFGLAVNAEIQPINSENFSVNIILIDEDNVPYSLLEVNSLLEPDEFILLEEHAEETCILNGKRPAEIRLEIDNAIVNISGLSYTTGIKAGWNINEMWKAEKYAQNEDKIQRINTVLKVKNKHWVAGHTGVSEMSYADRKKLYGQSNFPSGFEFYCGGVISAGETESSDPILKSATTTSPYVNEWDWRNRHGKNWITPITNQGSCGSCWAFAATGATEALTNLFYNQLLNLDLSEQDLVSCSNAGDCSGGLPGDALSYIQNKGIVDEIAFPYSSSNDLCSNKSSSPSELIKIGGKIDFGYSPYLKTEDNLKQMLISYGPLSAGVITWSHALVLVGYKVVKEGDTFFYQQPDFYHYWTTIEAGDPLIGKTVWIFKNSWGPYYGDQGYVYMETPIENIGWTHAIQTPVTSIVNDYQVQCTDADGDGYYWWGLGEKPANCPPCPDLADGDDSDPTLGPLDQYGYCMPLTKPVQPIANFSASTTQIFENETVLFTELSENTPTSYYWEFAGGTPATSTSKSPTVSYNTIGSFQVKLTVTNTAGSDTKTLLDYINVSAAPVSLKTPVADFTIPTTIETGQSVVFSDASINTPTSWLWSFEGAAPSSSTESSQAVVFNTAGTYSVSLTASNSAGSSTTSKTITVVDPILLPEADFIADQTIVEEGQSINFSDKSKNNPSSWRWEFEGGNPATSSERNPKVSYASSNSYKVTLTVTNAAGNDTKTMEDYILVEKAQAEYCTPIANASDQWISNVTIADDSYSSESSGYADYSANKSFGLEAGKSNFIQLTPDFSGRSGFEYWVVWIDFNADYIFTNDEIVFEPSKSKSAVTGTITIPTGMELKTRMRVAMASSTPGACDNAITGEVEDYTVIISPPIPLPPSADFAANVYTITEGETIQFSDISANAPTSWSWSFPGAATTSSSYQNPGITYNTPGVYNVSLTVSNAQGSSTLTKPGLITVLAQGEASFCTPENINSSSCFINKIIIGDYSSQSGADNYSFSSDIVSLSPGTRFNVELFPSDNSVRNFWRIWVDVNGDGDFEDADETLLAVNNNKGSVSSSITIPSYANGSTRLRISMKSGKAPTVCDDGFNGEVEDYNVSFGILPGQGMASDENPMTVVHENFVSVYPNPTQDIVNLKLMEISENDSYAVYNSVGVKIQENHVPSIFNVIDLSDQPSGMYLIRVKAKDHIYTSKIIRK